MKARWWWLAFLVFTGISIILGFTTTHELSTVFSVIAIIALIGAIRATAKWFKVE